MSHKSERQRETSTSVVELLLKAESVIKGKKREIIQLDASHHFQFKYISQCCIERISKYRSSLFFPSIN